jgi:hypothetical protein
MNKLKIEEDKFNHELEGLSRRSGQNEIGFLKRGLSFTNDTSKKTVLAI